MRFGLADAGDSLEDANFTTEGADAAVLRLYTQMKWTEEILAAKDLREGEPNTFEDKVFSSLINKCINETEKHYERFHFREWSNCAEPISVKLSRLDFLICNKQETTTELQWEASRTWTNS